MSEADTTNPAQPPEAYLVGPLVCKIVLLASAAAGLMGFFFSRLGGCDWPGTIWRVAVAATVVAFFGGLLAGPLQKAITPESKKEPESSGGPTPGSTATQPIKQT